MAGPRVARVLPDLAIDKVFDYLVPDHLAGEVRIGTMVRVTLNGRRIGGWVVAMVDAAGTDRPLQPLAKVTGWGPRADVVALARWAAWRWAGRPAQLLGTASPPRAVRGLPPAPPRPTPPVVVDAEANHAFTVPSGLAVVRLPPPAAAEAQSSGTDATR